MYNRKHNLASIAGQHGPCGRLFETVFDTVSSSIKMIGKDFFIDNVTYGACPETLNPVSFGVDNYYVPVRDLVLSFDMRSIVLSLAVNQQITSIDALKVFFEIYHTNYMTDLCYITKCR
jgi:hypothetical protein